MSLVARNMQNHGSVCSREMNHERIYLLIVTSVFSHLSTQKATFPDFLLKEFWKGAALHLRPKVCGKDKFSLSFVVCICLSISHGCLVSTWMPVDHWFPLPNFSLFFCLFHSGRIYSLKIGCAIFTKKLEYNFIKKWVLF